MHVWFGAEPNQQLADLVEHLNQTAIVSLTPSDVVRYAIQQLYREHFSDV